MVHTHTHTHTHTHKSRTPGYHGDCILYGDAKYLWVFRIEFAACHSSVADNFEALHSGNICASLHYGIKIRNPQVLFRLLLLLLLLVLLLSLSLVHHMNFFGVRRCKSILYLGKSAVFICVIKTSLKRRFSYHAVPASSPTTVTRSGFLSVWAI